ncbi:MAG: hypothetical protein HOV83_10980, partial [Catenulispora sp.]|nr:hypothetical protein [Catenulispora sp.]
MTVSGVVADDVVEVGAVSVGVAPAADVVPLDGPVRELNGALDAELRPPVALCVGVADGDPVPVARPRPGVVCWLY